MDANLAYKELQKKISLFLKKYDFKKIKSMFVLELPEAYVCTSFGRPHKLRESRTVVWCMSSYVRFKLLDPVFRVGRETDFSDYGATDVVLDGQLGLYNENPPGTLYTIDDSTDIDEQAQEFMALATANLAELPVLCSIENRRTILLDHLKNTKHIEGHILTRYAVFFKLLGEEDVYQEIYERLKEHHSFNTWFVQNSLQLAEKVAKEKFSQQLSAATLNTTS
jgi:hypothetical protein